MKLTKKTKKSNFCSVMRAGRRKVNKSVEKEERYIRTLTKKEK